MNEESIQLLEQILESTQETTSAIGTTDDSIQNVDKAIAHLSGQMDILNHSVYVQNEYLTWLTISMMLVAALMMFLVGYFLTRK